MRAHYLATVACIAVLATASAGAQGNSNIRVRTVQPKIIVIPFTKEGEDLRKVAENDPLFLRAQTMIKEAFERRHFTTVDFFGALKSALEGSAMSEGAEVDLKTRILEMSRADIYVVARVVESRIDANRHTVSIDLNAHLVANGMAYGSKVGHSEPKLMEVPADLMIEKAVEAVSESFLQVMQEKFDDVVENGVPVRVEYTVKAGARTNLEAEIDPDGSTLADKLEAWLVENSVNQAVHVAMTTKNRMVVDEVRLKLYEGDPASSNPRPFNTNRFARAMRLGLRKYVRAMSISSTNGVIYVELQ